jgi:hypothetical protein
MISGRRSTDGFKNSSKYTMVLNPKVAGYACNVYGAPMGWLILDSTVSEGVGRVDKRMAVAWKVSPQRCCGLTLMVSVKLYRAKPALIDLSSTVRFYPKGRNHF